MSTINGYPCANCAQEALAKRQLDPRKSSVELQSEARTKQERAQPPLGVNAPQAGAAIGSRLNVYG